MSVNRTSPDFYSKELPSSSHAVKPTAAVIAVFIGGRRSNYGCQREGGERNAVLPGAAP
jgi:hypothetical protein